MQKPVIYYVDDEEGILDLARSSINKNKYDLRVFTSPMLALAALHDDKPSVIFSDQKMDGMDGFSFLKIVNQFDKDIKLFLVSAFTENREEMLKSGYLQGFMKKDIDTPLKVQESLEKLLYQSNSPSINSQENDEQIFLLIYKSKVGSNFKDKKNLGELDTNSDLNSTENVVSGLQLINDEQILRVLEGEPFELLNLFQEITQRGKNEENKILWFGEIKGRIFPNGSMLKSEIHPELFNQCYKLLSTAKKRDIKYLYNSMGWVIRLAQEQHKP